MLAHMGRSINLYKTHGTCFKISSRMFSRYFRL